MSDNESFKKVLINHAYWWISHFRGYRMSYIDEWRLEVAKQIPGRGIKYSNLNVYLNCSDGRLRIIWYRFADNPKKHPNSKKFLSVGKNHSVNRNNFHSGPCWEGEVANRCEDEFARIRELNSEYQKIVKAIEHFNRVSAGEFLSQKYGTKMGALPLRLALSTEAMPQSAYDDGTMSVRYKHSLWHCMCKLKEPL